MCWTSFYIYFYNYLDLYGLELVWNLFKIYDIDAFYFIYLNLWLNIYFLNTCWYPWISADMKKIDEYPHNGYPTDMSTGTWQIFIQRVRYRETTTRTLPALLTSLLPDMQSKHHPKGWSSHDGHMIVLRCKGNRNEMKSMKGNLIFFLII